MKRFFVAAGVVIVIGTGLIALNDFGGRAKRETAERRALLDDLKRISALAPAIKDADINDIDDFCNKKIEAKNLNYYRRREIKGEVREDFFDIKPSPSVREDEKIIINYYNCAEFDPIFRKSITLDFRNNTLHTNEFSEHVILMTPVVIGKSWLSTIEIDGENIEFISEIRKTNLQRSIILNWRSYVLEGIIESYFESDRPIEGGHQLLIYNFRWSPQVNCFTEITMKRLTETENDTVSETTAYILKEVVAE
ncbi:MAG: hypothetical protein AB7T10_07270 [bacterium]